MPIVPRRNPNSYVPTAARPVLRPGNAFQPAAPVPVGQAVRVLSGVLEREREHADEVIVQEADNKLAAIQLDLQSKASKREGKDAYGVADDMEAEWVKQAAEVETTLSTDRQREAVRRIAAKRQLFLKQSLTEYQKKEWGKFEDRETKTFLDNRVNDAVANYANPEALNTAVAQAKAAVLLYGDRHGFSPEQVKAAQLGETTRIHDQVIDRMIADGKDITAVEYFKKVKAEIQGDSATKISEKLETSSTEGEASRGATDIWKRLGPKSLNDPVTLSAMEQEARDKYPDNPRVVKAVIQDLRSRKQAHNEDQREATATFRATILGKFKDGASVQALVRSPAYLALDGTNQEQLKNYMMDSRRADANRTPDTKNWAAYWGYSAPATLARMSENQILSLVPEIGQGLVNDLMQKKRTVLKTDEQVREAAIDADQFGTLAKDAGFNPFDKPDADEKEVLARLRSSVESEIARAQDKAGRKLMRDEKQDIMQKVLDQKVMLDWSFRSDPERTATVVAKDDRDSAYVPISKVSPQFVTLAIDWMRQNGNVVAGESTTNVMNRFGRRIERAYAARILGRSKSEIADILAGR